MPGLAYLQTVTEQMDKLDPPVELAEEKSKELIQYMREKIFVMSEYETNFPPVNVLHVLFKSCIVCVHVLCKSCIVCVCVYLKWNFSS